ncbi:MAG: hypothetical protein FJX42_03555 [Alphaproteobacteria bacterium]|nr:hypothetical protein [Alphaproteobacteria bacterium]
MADGLNPISASVILQTAAPTFTSLSAPGTVPSGRPGRTGLGLPGDALAGSIQGSPASLDVADARRALAIAITNGRRILDTLDSLQAAVDFAAVSSLVGGDVQLAVGGTRISRLNIQAEARQALREINTLVEKSEVNGVNLIASDGRAAQAQTTRFGGQTTLDIQPLDSRALGFGAPELSGLVSGFKGLSDKEIEAVARKLAVARETVSRRLQTLTQSEERLAYASGAGQAVRTLEGAGNALLPRGSVVNLIA